MEEEIDLGENRTVFTRSHADIKANGKTMCLDHKWRKVNENELECKECPTVIICALDDPRLLVNENMLKSG